MYKALHDFRKTDQFLKTALNNLLPLYTFSASKPACWCLALQNSKMVWVLISILKSFLTWITQKNFLLESTKDLIRCLKWRKNDYNNNDNNSHCQTDGHNATLSSLRAATSATQLP